MVGDLDRRECSESTDLTRDLLNTALVSTVREVPFNTARQYSDDPPDWFGGGVPDEILIALWRNIRILVHYNRENIVGTFSLLPSLGEGEMCRRVLRWRSEAGVFVLDPFFMGSEPLDITSLLPGTTSSCIAYPYIRGIHSKIIAGLDEIAGVIRLRWQRACDDNLPVLEQRFASRQPLDFSEIDNPNRYRETTNALRFRQIGPDDNFTYVAMETGITTRVGDMFLYRTGSELVSERDERDDFLRRLEKFCAETIGNGVTPREFKEVMREAVANHDRVHGITQPRFHRRPMVAAHAAASRTV